MSLSSTAVAVPTAFVSSSAAYTFKIVPAAKPLTVTVSFLPVTLLTMTTLSAAKASVVSSPATSTSSLSLSNLSLLVKLTFTVVASSPS